MASSTTGSRSPSVDSALRWAQACAALGDTERPVNPTDVFLGLLLAHPDDRGEMRVLLTHFGLTARDLVPDDYPAVTNDSLRDAARSVKGVDPDAWDADVGDILDLAGSLSGGTTQLAHVVGALLSRSTPFLERLDHGISRFGIEASQLASEFTGFLSGVVDEPDDSAAAGDAQGLDLSSRVTAGEQMRDWLASRFPRRPASMAGFASEAIDPESDYIGIGVEADAFAYLIASKALAPPLAIGLFGDWGSGKSFLMARVRRRVKDLTGLAADAASPVWPRVAEIEFSAWQYVETDLWAALLHHIFEKLTPSQLDELSEVDRARAAVDPLVADKKRDAEKAEQRVARFSRRQDRLTRERRRADATLVRTAQDLEKLRAPMTRQALTAGDRARLAQQLALGAAVLGPEAEDALEAAGKLTGALRRPAWQQRKYWPWRRVAITAVSVALVPLVALVVHYWTDSALGTLASTLAVLLAPIGVVLRTLATVAEQGDRDVQAAEEEVDRKLAAMLQAAAEESRAAAARLDEADTKLRKAVKTSREAQLEHEALVQRREAITTGSLYSEFLSARKDSDDYRRHLGLVSTIRQDLDRLATLTTEYNQGERIAEDEPPNRIVLYVDDLDRCPPARVVEVLEAVHLLLAIPLFVVIVAVDTRWLTHALEKALPTLAETRGDRDAAPTAMAYLEKIFQIPFWVERLDEDGRKRLLRGLLLKSVAQPVAQAGEASDTGLSVGERETELVDAMLTSRGLGLDLDARQLTITPDELAFIESLAGLFTGTPREAKRFVNTCQLMLAMAPPLSGEGSCPTERMAACFMTALHESMPGLAAGVAAVEPGNQHTVTLNTVLNQPDVATGAGRVREWLLEHNGLHAHRQSTLFEDTAVDVFLKRWDLIRRLRFTMAPQEPPDPVQVDPTTPAPAGGSR